MFSASSSYTFDAASARLTRHWSSKGNSIVSKTNTPARVNCCNVIVITNIKDRHLPCNKLSATSYLKTETPVMLKNLLLIAVRNFRKDKWYSLLNVLGLTIGITFSLFLIFYVADELSYDRFHKKADRIFRVDSYIHEKDKNTNWSFCL